jgi:DNA polymerase-3 subunit alpha
LNMFTSLSGDHLATGGLFEFPNGEEWDEREKLRKEKEALGFYITGHPLDGFKDEVKCFATCVIQDLPVLNDKSTVKVAGVIENLKIKRTKKGEKMAILTLEDQTGSVQVILFPDVFNNYSYHLKGDDPLLISGTAELDDNSSKIIAQEIHSLQSMRQKTIRAIELGLNQDTVSRELLEQIKDVIFRYPGECSVFFRVGLDREKEIIIAAHNHYQVFPCDEMIGEIETIIGQKVSCRYG